MSDRRDYERLLIRKFAILKLANGATIEGETRDMSMGGIFIECEPNIDLTDGTECSVSLALADGSENITTETYGTICHNSDGGVGLLFLKVNSTYYQFIEEHAE